MSRTISTYSLSSQITDSTIIFNIIRAIKINKAGTDILLISILKLLKYIISSNTFVVLQNFISEPFLFFTLNRN